MFLFEKGKGNGNGPDVVQQLITCEMKYHNFYAVLNRVVELAVEAQKKLSESGIDPNAAVQVVDLEAVLGFDLKMKLESTIDGTFAAADPAEEHLRKAADDLPEHLKSRFKNWTLVIKLPTNEEVIKSLGVVFP
jgi:hypothetical protein